MRLFRFTAALALLLVAAAPAFADIALPNPKPKDEKLGEVRRDLPFSRMTIERVEGLREARLQIPRSSLSGLGLSAGLIEQPSAPSGTWKGAGTAVAGLFLSLGVILTGVMLVRSRRRGVAVGRAAVVTVVCVCAAGLAAVAAYANIAPPQGYRPQDPGTLIKAVSGQSLKGSIRIEVVEEGSEVKLLVPARSQRAKGEEEE